MNKTRWTIQSKHLETPPQEKEDAHIRETHTAKISIKNEAVRPTIGTIASKPNSSKSIPSKPQGIKRYTEQTEPIEQKDHVKPFDHTPVPLRYKTVVYEKLYGDKKEERLYAQSVNRGEHKMYSTVDASKHDWVEPLIDVVSPKTNAHPETKINQDDKVIDGPSYVSPVHNHKRSRPPFYLGPRFREPMRWTLSIVSAIVLGAMFGYVLLWLALHQGWLQSAGLVPGLPSKNAQQTNGSLLSSDSKQENTGTVPNAVSGALTLPKQTFYMLQGGVFNERASLEPLVEKAKAQNLPVLILDGSPLRLIYGLLPNEQEANLLAKYYAEKNIDIFVRPLVFNASSQAFAALKEEDVQRLSRFFTHGFYLYTESAAWMTEGISSPVKIEEQAWRTFRETHQQFVEESRQLQNVLTGAEKEAVSEMTKEMTTAVTALVEYIKTPDEHYLLTIEQAHLNFIQAMATFYPDAFKH